MRLTVLFLICFLQAVHYAGAAESNYLTHIRRLSDPTMDVDNPSWSPDKKWIAASNIRVDGAEADELWLFDAGSGNKRKLLGADRLATYGAYGYSIWDIKWINNNELSFVLSDNDVDSFLITLSVRSPGHFKESARDPEPEFGKIMPDELKEYLIRYYPEDTDQRIDLEENPTFYHFEYLGGKWYVQHLRDQEILVVDLKAGSHARFFLSLPADQIGDNLEFRQVGNDILAVYPVARSNDYIADRLGPGQKVVQLFRVGEYPNFFYSPADSHLYIYTRTKVEHPIRQLRLYRLARTLEPIPTQDWHNFAFSQDGRSIAFIRMENKKRVLYTGKWISKQARPTGLNERH
jgi:dipeptidyl aminopeptidase/acylaminoacyl peptidase